MSGGSFEYMFSKDIEDLVSPALQEDLERMADTLDGYGFLNASQETRTFIGGVKHLHGLIASLEKDADRLRDVWQAVEWYTSGDIGNEELERRLRSFTNP